MIAILSLLVVVVLSILVTRIATVALTHTGLSRESARFQARSAFTGAGFTTSESEKVVNHPVRRRIVLLLMLLGNAGIVTAVSSLILTFVKSEAAVPLELRVVFLVGGLVVLWALASSRFVDRHLSRLIERVLSKTTNLEIRDFAGLMNLDGGHTLAELQVQQDDWLAGKDLAQCRLRDEGVVVLGIRRADGTWLGAPTGNSGIEAGDTLVVYGREDALEELDVRRRGREGDARHDAAVEEQEKAVADEARADRERKADAGESP